MKSEFNFIDVIERAKKALKIKQDNELADLLGMSAASFNGRKKSDSIPYEALLALANKENIDFNWLLTGEGRMYRGSVSETPAAYGNEKTKKMAELFDDLDSNGQREILSRLEEKKRLSELEFIVDKLQRKVG